MKDFYKSNGRIRHERINIEIGHLLNIQVHSYQSKQISDRINDICETETGGLEHFDIDIYRNVDIIGGKPFERIKLKDLYGELCEFCQHACKDCYIKELKRKYNIEDMSVHCSALYITIRLLGDNQDSINYYLNSVAKLEKTCKDEMDRDCHNCKYNASLHTRIPCYGYIIGMALLREI